MLIEFDILKKYGIVPRGTIHVGMHKAEEYQIYKDSGVEHIIFIEANRELVKDAMDMNMDAFILNAAISDKRENISFNITNNGESSSILELGDHASIYPGIVNIKTVEMETMTLDDVILGGIYHGVLVPFDSRNYNILNLDIQGAELKAMKGFSWWEMIDAIFTEVNYREMYKGCALIGEIEEFLTDKGFVKVEEVDTGAGWGDALFVKKEYV
jgi:FkbM family methyltransferase